MLVLCIWLEVFWKIGRSKKSIINFEEELKKFKPSPELDEAEDAIYRNDLKDVVDILEEVKKEMQQSSRN